VVLFGPCSNLFSFHIGGEGERFHLREGASFLGAALFAVFVSFVFCTVCLFSGSVTRFFVVGCFARSRFRWFRDLVQRLVVLDFVLLGGLLVL